jgi:hypothetical protein
MVECGFYIATKRHGTLTPAQVSLVLKHPRLATKLLHHSEVVQNLTPEQLSLAFDHVAVSQALFQHVTAIEQVARLGCEDSEFHMTAVPKVAKFLAESETSPADREDLSADIRALLAGWQFLSEMEQGAMLGEEELEYAGRVLKQVPSAARKTRIQTLVTAVAVALNDADRLDLSKPLEAALVYLQPKNPQVVYAQLCEYFSARAPQLKRPALVIALVAVGVGHCQTDGLARSLGDAGAEQAAGLIRALKTAKKKLLLRAISNASKTWKTRKAKEAIRRLLPPPLFMRKWFLLLVLLLLLITSVVAGLYYFGDKLPTDIQQYWKKKPDETQELK